MRARLSLLALLPFLFASTALAYGAARAWTETQALSRAAPTGASEGIQLGNVAGYRITVCAASGQTLAGGGNIHMYTKNEATGLWARNPSLDLAMSVISATSCAGAACRCVTFPDREVVARNGARLLPAANAVTVSGGTTVDVRVDAWLE